MKEQAWSPEPWLDRSDRRIAYRVKGLSVDGVELSLDDYDRARECVNACQGIENPEAIGEVVEGLRRLDSEAGEYADQGKLELRWVRSEIRTLLRKLEQEQ